MDSLETITGNICGEKKCLQIMNNDFFDPIFSIIYYLEDITLSIRKELISLLNGSLKSFLKILEKKHILNEDQSIDNRLSLQSGVSISGRTQEVQIFRNALKAYVYLIS
jgi:hypothetical protein